MPDHVHWLLRLNEGQDLSAGVQKARSLASRKIRQVAGHESFAGQPGYFDRALRGDEDLAAVARYIVANPVRAGLVKSVRDYPHWDAVWL
ncbi:MAG: transposase [Halothiobacillaceae bacterium]|nr:transposase [Halothiobacillaceae bacterium]